MSIPDPTSTEYEQAVAARWGPRDPTIRSFWQSAVVLSEINRRVTGDPDLTPPQYFARTYCGTPRKRGLSLGCGDGGIELAMLQLGACEHIVAIDLSAERLDRARAATPPELIDRLELVRANIETWRPEGRFDLVIANGVVHHLERLEEFFDLLDDVLTDDGLLYLDEFVGPSRFQWTDRQLEVVNRLLDRLSPDLRRDLTLPEPGPRPPFTRPSPARLIAADPSEAARSAEIPGLLHERLVTVEEHACGGAIFHQLFNRIMGNFSGHDDFVRVIMELDAILTENRLVDNDFLWGVYRRSQNRSHLTRTVAETDGRLESIEGRTVVGWAASIPEWGRRLSVDLYVDHRLVAKALADLPRDDLVTAGIGDGQHSFRIELPSFVCDGGHRSISLVVPSVGSTLPVARGWEHHNRTTPNATEFAWARHDPSLTLPVARVLNGRDGWTFAGDDAVGSIEQLLGTLTLTAPDLLCYKALLTRRAHTLAELGIPFIVAIAPAKAAVHPERLPASSPALGPPKLGRQLLECLDATDVTAVDLLPPLRAGALAGRQLYYQRGSHWTYEGALIAAQALINAVRRAGVPAAELLAHDIPWRPESCEGDLSGRPTVALEDGRLRAATPARGAETAPAPDERALGLFRAAAPTHVCAYDPGGSVIENRRYSAGPRAVVIRDWDGGRLEAVAAPGFSRSVWVTGAEIDAALLEAECPAVVLQVLDESRLVRVPYGVAD